MENVKANLEAILKDAKSRNPVFQRNVFKEYLQILALDYIYAHPKYSNLVFYGGSCLAQCFGLPRLSEDLDFVDLKKEINLSELARDMEEYFRKNTDLDVKATVQKFRVYLKFPILYDLGLAGKSESDLLFLKIEIFSGFDFCRSFRIENIPLFKSNKSILIKTFDFPTLMATKIRAVLFRKWEKTDKKGNVFCKVKGRDYFDLMWYLERNVVPNLNCFEKGKSMETLKKELLDAVDKADVASIRIDLESLIADFNFADNLSKNIKDILKRGINALK